MCNTIYDKIPTSANHVEVTDAMLAAGVKEVRAFDRRVAGDEDLALWVWEAMEAARRKPRLSSSSPWA